MSAKNIKSDFKNWLIKKGYQETNARGRPSTVYDYIRRIDRICDRLYDEHDADHWDNLAKDIFPVLVGYYECGNKGYYITQTNAGVIYEHINEVLKLIYFTKKHSKKNAAYPLATLRLIYNEKEDYALDVNLDEASHYIDAFRFIIDAQKNNSDENLNTDLVHTYYIMVDKIKCVDRASLYTLIDKYIRRINEGEAGEKHDVVLSLKYIDRENLKNKIVLEKFYNFLRDRDCSIKRKSESRLNYLAIDQNLEHIASFKDGLLYIRTIRPKTGKRPKKIEAHHPSLLGALHQKEVADALDCDPRAIHGLKSKNELSFMSHHPTRTRSYSEGDINRYLKKHYHRAKPVYSNVDYSNNNPKSWCNLKTAAQIVGCSTKTIQRYRSKRILTYTDNTLKTVKYYIPELKHIRKNPESVKEAQK